MLMLVVQTFVQACLHHASECIVVRMLNNVQNGLPSISGLVYRVRDGATVPLSGVKLTLKLGSRTVGIYTTNSGGTYSFTNLAPGTYTVREVVGAGWVRTGPTNTDNYCVTVSAGKDSGGNNFANAEAGCDCQIYCVTYIINGCRQVSDLRGNVNPGDSVVARAKLRSEHLGGVWLVPCRSSRLASSSPARPRRIRMPRASASARPAAAREQQAARRRTRSTRTACSRPAASTSRSC